MVMIHTVINKLLKSDWQSLETWWNAASHKKHSGKKISMTVPQKADLSLLEMLSGYKYQQLVNWKQDGKEDGLSRRYFLQ